eukprot:s512_g9.t1
MRCFCAVLLSVSTPAFVVLRWGPRLRFSSGRLASRARHRARTALAVSLEEWEGDWEDGLFPSSEEDPQQAIEEMRREDERRRSHAMSAGHHPVQEQESVDALLGTVLGRACGGQWVDGTFGRGGHSRSILARPSACVSSLNSLPFANQSIDKLMTAPPWDRQFEASGGLRSFYSAMLPELFRLLRSDGSMALLLNMEAAKIMRELLTQEETWGVAVERRFDITHHTVGVLMLIQPKDPGSTLQTKFSLLPWEDEGSTRNSRGTWSFWNRLRARSFPPLQPIALRGTGGKDANRGRRVIGEILSSVDGALEKRQEEKRKKAEEEKKKAAEARKKEIAKQERADDRTLRARIIGLAKEALAEATSREAEALAAGAACQRLSRPFPTGSWSSLLQSYEKELLTPILNATEDPSAWARAFVVNFFGATA